MGLFPEKRRVSQSVAQSSCFVTSVPLAIRDVLTSYEVPEDVVLAGSLYDVLHNAQKRDRDCMARIQTAIEEQYDGDIVSLVKSLSLTDSSALCKKFADTPVLFVLKLASLVQDASEMASLEDHELDTWAEDATVMMEVDYMAFMPKSYLDSCKDMVNYLQEAHEYYLSTQQQLAA